MKNLLTDIAIRRAFLLLLLALLTIAAGPADKNATTGSATVPVMLEAGLSPKEATIGDRVTYTLTLTRSSETLLKLPKPPHTIDGMTLLASRETEPERAEGKIIEQGIYTYRVDRTGTIDFPAVSGTYLDGGEEKTVSTPALTLPVQSVLPGDMKDIHEIKGLEPAGFFLPAPFYITAALLLCVLLGIVFWRHRKKRAAMTFIEPLRTPREEAETALKELAAMDLIEKGEFRKYCFLLSEIFRRYIERRFRFPAVESTSEEIRRHLGALPVGEHVKEEVRLFLVNTDRVKYAGAAPARKEVDGETARVQTFLETTSREEIAAREEDHVAL